MAHAAVQKQFEIGVAGLDVSGRKIIRALVAHGVKVIAFHRDSKNIKALWDEAGGASIHVTPNIKKFMGSFGKSRTILVIGTDAAGGSFGDVLEHLTAGDLLIDAGHCYFKDCIRRANSLAERNIRYLGIGILGGEAGCCGPTLMAGGRPEIYSHIRHVLEFIAQKETGEPSVNYLGPAVAGHFVKMIHDGIEYSLRQIFVETLDLLKQLLHLGDDELRGLVRGWQTGAFNDSLRDDHARWTSRAARELNVPIPTIDAAVGMRMLSEFERQNQFATTPFRQPLGHFADDKESILVELHGALCAAIMITYAEGIGVLRAGSEQYGFGFNVAAVIDLWKGCRNQRIGFLNEITSAFHATPDLPNLLHDDDLSQKVMEQQERLRHAIWRAGVLHKSVPALTASLDYLDSCRGAWLPGNLLDSGHLRRHSLRPLPAAD